MVFKVRRTKLGVSSGHVRMTVFAGAAEGSLAYCGKLVMRQDEFAVWKNGMTPFELPKIVEVMEHGFLIRSPLKKRDQGREQIQFLFEEDNSEGQYDVR